MTTTRLRSVALLASLALAARLGAQAPDPATRLRQVLPADVAERVLAQAAAASREGLPGLALEERALKFAARGIPAAAIEKAVAEQGDRMARAQVVLKDARSRPPAKEEIEAGAEALREGVDASTIATLARTAPAGRSLAVPLFVLGSLATRGVGVAEALRVVADRLHAAASDADLERLPDAVRPDEAAEAASAADVGRGAESNAHRVPEHAAPHPMPRMPHPSGHRPGRP